MPVSMLSTSLITNPRKYGRFNALDTIYTPPLPPKPGMVLVSPTSITHSGTSATLGANGQVTFSAVTSLSLNGVFKADFDNYVIAFRHVMNTSGIAIAYRMRAAGADDSTSDSYTRQFLTVDGSTITASRSSSTNGSCGYASSTNMSGQQIYVYGPYLAQPTAVRAVDGDGAASATIFDVANTHNQSTSYDGITLFVGSNNLTGTVAVYGVRS